MIFYETRLGLLDSLFSVHSSSFPRQSSSYGLPEVGKVIYYPFCKAVVTEVYEEGAKIKDAETERNRRIPLVCISTIK